MNLADKHSPDLFCRWHREAARRQEARAAGRRSAIEELHPDLAREHLREETRDSVAQLLLRGRRSPWIAISSGNVWSRQSSRALRCRFRQ